MKIDNLAWLQEWYRSSANGNWEHQYGVTILTIDNPGWSVDIDLADTELIKKPFSRLELEESDSNWIRCWIENGKFKITCGPLNLNQGLEIFRNWVQEKAVQ